MTNYTASKGQKHSSSKGTTGPTKSEPFEKKVSTKYNGTIQLFFSIIVWIAYSMQPIQFEFKKSQTTSSRKGWFVLSTYLGCIFELKVSPQQTATQQLLRIC